LRSGEGREREKVKKRRQRALAELAASKKCRGPVWEAMKPDRGVKHGNLKACCA
jgi:hypothetical protein